MVEDRSEVSNTRPGGSALNAVALVVQVFGTLLIGGVLGVAGSNFLSKPQTVAVVQSALVWLSGLGVAVIAIYFLMRVVSFRARRLVSPEALTSAVLGLFEYASASDPERKLELENKLRRTVGGAANLLVSALVASQALALVAVLLGSLIALATLLTAYMQVDRLDRQNTLITEQTRQITEQTKQMKTQSNALLEGLDLSRREALSKRPLLTLFDRINGTTMRVRNDGTEIARVETVTLDVPAEFQEANMVPDGDAPYSDGWRRAEAQGSCSVYVERRMKREYRVPIAEDPSHRGYELAMARRLCDNPADEIEEWTPFGKTETNRVHVSVCYCSETSDKCWRLSGYYWRSSADENMTTQEVVGCDK